MKTLQKPKLPHSSGLVLTIVLMTVALVQMLLCKKIEKTLILK